MRKINESPSLSLSDAEVIACDAVAECAARLSTEALRLFDAASQADVAETEARLWTCRRLLTVAIKTWREIVPSIGQGGAA